jgi:hypothetical protein
VEQAEESFLGIDQDSGEGGGVLARDASRNSFKDVGGALDYAGVVVPEKFKETGEEAGLGFDQGDDFRDSATRKGMFALEEESAKVGASRHSGMQLFCYAEGAI